MLLTQCVFSGFIVTTFGLPANHIGVLSIRVEVFNDQGGLPFMLVMIRVSACRCAVSGISVRLLFRGNICL